ncbi:MAG: hypothetical protein ACO331_07390 [Prochlorothrix sp.]
MKIVPLLLSSLGPVAATATQATAQDSLPAPPPLNLQPTLTLAQNNQLPASIANALLQQHAYTTGRPTYAFRVASATPATWSDSCLGLGMANELCAQAQVSGWQVTLADDIQTWVYRTDAIGLVMRLASSQSGFPGTGGVPPIGTPVNSPVMPNPVTPPITPVQPVVNQPVVNQPIANQGWNAELRWSRLTDSPDPELLFQLVVLEKPETRYANVVYQFYVREKGKRGWTYIYTTLGARLLENGAGSVELPLESLRLDEVATKMGYNFNWSNTDIRVSVLLRYDLDRQQRDLRLKFQHESAYAAISPLSLNQIAQSRPVSTPNYATPNYSAPNYSLPPYSTPNYSTPTAAPAYVPVSAPAPPPGVPVLPPLATPYPYMN